MRDLWLRGKLVLHLRSFAIYLRLIIVGGIACAVFLVPAVSLIAADPNSTIRFRDVTKEAGLAEPLAALLGHGGAVGDYDGDGHLDVYVGGFADRPDVEYAPAKGPVHNRLLRNTGGGRFEAVAMASVEIYGRTSGAVFADLDNNGTLDLYVANNAKTRGRKTKEPQESAVTLASKLFCNDGSRFIDVSHESGACPPSLHTARNVGVFDYNADGLLDLLVIEDRFTPRPRSVLFKNTGLRHPERSEGSLRFDDANHAVGLPDDVFGLGCAVADLNNDMLPDFFVGHSNRLFLSDGEFGYREAIELRQVFAWDPLDSEDWPCGAAFGDLNGDGLLDLVLSIHSVRARNRVFLNEGLKDGIPQFRDRTQEVGLGTTVPARCPHVEVQDFDNDGRMDIYISAGWLEDDGAFTPLIYRNVGIRDGVPRFVPPRPIQAPMAYFPAGPSGDVNNDGRLDLFLVNWFGGNHSRLLQNESAGNHWLDVQVVGRTINRMGIGSKVRVYHAGKLGRNNALLGVQNVSTGYGYASGQAAICHFGLGEHAAVDVEVVLPNGQTQRKTHVKADQRLIVREQAPERGEIQ